MAIAGSLHDGANARRSNRAPDPDVADAGYPGPLHHPYIAVVPRARDALASMPQRFSATLLGRPSLHVDGKSIDRMLGSKPRALISYLLRADGPVSRSQLAGLLWGQSANEAARANLRLALSRLRQRLPGILHADKHALWLEPNCIADVDILAFDAAVARLPGGIDEANIDCDISERKEAMLGALELYRGPFLEGFEVRGAPAFDDWLRRERAAMQRAAVAIARYLLPQQVEPVASARNNEQDIAIAQRWLAIDESDEAAHCMLMALYAQAGQRTLAIGQYEKLREILASSLGARPSAQTYELYRCIHADAPEQPLVQCLPSDGTVASRQRAADGKPVFAGHVSEYLPPPMEGLPRPAGLLIGRSDLLNQVDALFCRPQCRLITLVGAGGMGKTRIGIAAAQRFDCPVTFVPLAGLPPAEGESAVKALVVQIAQSIDLRFKAPQPAGDVLISTLAGQNRLLLLDNFEHLLDARPFVHELLSAAPGIRLLVTSRERLGMSAEWVVDVPGLGPDDAALQLFESVAVRVSPGFDMAAHLSAVRRIIRFVQGSPLGIELAANWVRALPCQEIASRLEKDLDILTACGNVSDSRHRSMRAVLDSSWSLLDAPMRESLAALCVFPGSFDAAASDAVARCNPLTLATLADLNWVEPVKVASGPRYQVHELLRRYGQEKLAGLTQQAPPNQVYERHANYFTERLIAARQELESFDERAVRIIDQDLPNTRAAWRWLARNSSAPQVADFIASAHPYFIHKGWLSEAIEMLEQALELPDASRPLTISWQRMLAQDQWQSGHLGRCRVRAEQVVRGAGEHIPDGGVALWRTVSVSLVRHVAGLAGLRWPVQETPWAQDQAYAFARLSSIGYLAAESRFKLLHYGLRCHQLSVAHNIAGGMMWSKAYLATVWRTIGSERIANFFGARAYATLPKLRTDSFSALGAQMLGIDQFISGNWDNAAAMMQRSADCYRTTGEWRLTIDACAVTGLLELARGRTDAAHDCWLIMREGGSQYGDRIVELWGLLGAIETDLSCGRVPEKAMLADADNLLDAGTMHEAARYHASLGAIALANGDRAAAALNAGRALSMLRRRRFLPFYQGQACYNTACVMFKLARDQPTRQPLRDEADIATALLYKYAKANSYVRAKACLLRGDYERLAGRASRARRLYERARRSALALGLDSQALAASQALSALGSH